jgi:hypothetical protein
MRLHTAPAGAQPEPEWQNACSQRRASGFAPFSFDPRHHMMTKEIAILLNLVFASSKCMYSYG